MARLGILCAVAMVAGCAHSTGVAGLSGASARTAQKVASEALQCQDDIAFTLQASSTETGKPLSVSAIGCGRGIVLHRIPGHYDWSVLHGALPVKVGDEVADEEDVAASLHRPFD